MKRIIVSHFGQYWVPIDPDDHFAMAFARWTEDDDFCPLCDSHPSSGHTAECPLVRAVYSGRIEDLGKVPEETE